MSLRPSLTGAVPESTAMVARAAFPRGNPYMRLRDILGTVFTDQQFAALFPSHGQPTEAPWRLALVTLLQFAENLSDRRAADAARSRIDWKHLLGLELADPGFDASVLSEFRSRPSARFAGCPSGGSLRDGRGRRGGASARHAAGAVPRAEAIGAARAAAHGQHPRSRGRTLPQPPLRRLRRRLLRRRIAKWRWLRHRGDAGSAERPGRCRS